ncbi:MAG: 2-C-methyl-D-erythritol 4-phosphate cytidylyltransferase [Bacteroidetes bacterium]|nr:2-C-methyl-D-erythritol 4-phosphate cytidylyltransferase [Bacteroidota bacterium]
MNAVVVVAGGSGRRMGGPVPKQYLNLQGKPVIIHTLERFYQFDPHIRIVLVMAENHKSFWDKIAFSSEASRAAEVLSGGETRYDSVKNGLQVIPDGCIVGIHDAVRPLVSLEAIGRCYRAAAETGSGIPVLEMDESVRIINGAGSENMERARLRRVQTPQTFRSELIREAYGRVFDSGFTDDASVFESIHGPLTLVPGNPENIKITSAIDLDLASLIL